MVIEAYERRDYKEVKRLTRMLSESYPDSDAARDARRLVADIESRQSGNFRNNEGSAQATNSTKSKQSSGSAKPAQKRRVANTSNRTRSSKPAQSAALKDAQRLVALKKMRIVRDDDQGITWYYNKHISHFVYKNSLESYIGQSDNGNTWLRMRIYYSGEKPLNIQGYEIYADDRIYPIKTKYGTLEKGSGPGGAWEWFDMQVHSKDLEVLKAAMTANRAAVRYIGGEESSDRVLPEGEKSRLLDIIKALEVLSSGTGQRYFAGNAPRPQ